MHLIFALRSIYLPKCSIFKRLDQIFTYERKGVLASTLLEISLTPPVMVLFQHLLTHIRPITHSNLRDILQ